MDLNHQIIKIRSDKCLYIILLLLMLVVLILEIIYGETKSVNSWNKTSDDKILKLLLHLLKNKTIEIPLN